MGGQTEDKPPIELVSHLLRTQTLEHLFQGGEHLQEVVGRGQLAEEGHQVVEFLVDQEVKIADRSHDVVHLLPLVLQDLLANQQTTHLSHWPVGLAHHAPESALLPEHRNLGLLTHLHPKAHVVATEDRPVGVQLGQSRHHYALVPSSADRGIAFFNI